MGDPATGTTITVSGPGGTSFIPSAINNHGQVVGSVYNPITRELGAGFIVDIGTGAITLLDVPGSSSTRPLDINHKGQVVGSYQIGSPLNDYAFVFDASTGQYTTMTVVPNTPYTYAYSINNAGQIIGEYNYYNVFVGYFLATPDGTGVAVPEPGSIALLGGGLGVLAWVRRRGGARLA